MEVRHKTCIRSFTTNTIVKKGEGEGDRGREGERERGRERERERERGREGERERVS